MLKSVFVFHPAIVGWCAHRVEEVYNPYGRIICPAYKAVAKKRPFVPLEERG